MSSEAKESFSFRAEPDLKDVLQKVDPNKTFSEHIRDALYDYINGKTLNINVESVDLIDLVESANSGKEFFTVAEFSIIFSRPKNTILDWISKGWLKAKKFGGIYLIHRSIIQKILDELRPTTTRIHTKLIPIEAIEE